MGIAFAVLGLILVLIVLRDTFETIVVPKTVERNVRISTFYYRLVWKVWHWAADRLPDGRARQTWLMSFGPLSLIFLFVVWAGILIYGFALVQFGFETLEHGARFGLYLYWSGETFFTLGYGDVASTAGIGMFLSVIEAGTGFGFLAIVIAYVPTLYQAFSRREHLIVMLDSRAGSDSSAGELLRRHVEAQSLPSLTAFLREAERWSAEQLETYLSYPILSYYRSQHDTQSWLTALTAILDTCALLLSGFEREEPWAKELRFQARATFAMARHVVVDLAYVLNDPPDIKAPGRRTPDDEAYLAKVLELACGHKVSALSDRLAEFSAMYEPYLVGLARDMHYTLPAWTPQPEAQDNWQRTAWEEGAHF